MIKEFKTDFSYINNRQYVHSSTLLEAIKTLALGDFQSGMDWDFPKIDASFHKMILSNGSFFISDEQKTIKKEKNTSASFKIYDENHTISAIFNETNNAIVSKNKEINYFVNNLSLTDSFEGSCLIDASTPSSFYENIIEANKRIHLLTVKNSYKNIKVINLYMKNCPLILSDENIKINIKFSNISVRKSAESIVTLNSLSFPGTDFESLKIAYMVNGI